MPNHEKPKSITVPLRTRVPDSTGTQFSNSFIVQHEADHFILSFYEVMRPAILGPTQEDRERQLGEIKEVESRCVARIVVTPATMKTIVKAVADNYSKFEIGMVKKRE